MVKQDPALAMMISLYATLGVFLLLASRNPSAHRSLIAFTAWSSLVHAAIMAVQAFQHASERGHLRLARRPAVWGSLAACWRNDAVHADILNQLPVVIGDVP
jgi:hypothetical protein